MFSSILFVVELMVAEFLLTFRLKHKSLYALRFAGLVAISLLAAFLIPSIENAWYNFFVYLALFAVTVLGLKLIYNEPWINVIFCGIAAYTMQHLAYQFTNLLFTLILWGESPLLGMYHATSIDVSQLSIETLFWLVIYAIGYFTAYGTMWLLCGQRITKNQDLKIKNKSLVALLGSCLVLNILLNVIAIFSDETQTVINSIIRHVSCVFNCLLLLQWQFELVHSKHLETELEVTKKLLSKSQEQYKVSRDNIELINLKCHDMKHQIRKIGSDKKLDDETIQDLEKSISVYDSFVKTENEALDVILTEMSFKCLRHNVILKCIANGKCLGFMKSSDIYSLFGNALDNAIEAVIKLQDKSQRVIGLKVYSVGGLITITVKNFYQGDVHINQDGLPDTTKSDKENHGYGMKSINFIVEKYFGSLSIKAKDNVFSLNILFPVKQSKL